MSSNRYTMDDVRRDEAIWKELVAQNEITLLNHYVRTGKLHKPYELAEKNAWIIRTLRDKKQRYKFDKCKNVVMIGSGMYPYSMFDLHKQYPHINQVGLEIDKKRAIISQKLVEACPAKDSIKIITIDAMDYDYSWLGIDDLIFVSVDVEHKDIVQKALKTSKAQLYICAPYDKSWLYNLVNHLT
jgi:hypothetical protein